MNTTVFTIGYSGFPNEKDFIAKLKSFGIDALCDVRSIPRSSTFKTYNDDSLILSLPLHKIFYYPFGKVFGARQNDRKYYTGGEDSYLDFESFSQSDLFNSGMLHLGTLLKAGYVPCLLCAEKEPADCHRAILVGRALRDAGYCIVHILPDTVKSQEDVDQEILAEYRKEHDQLTIFHDKQPTLTEEEELAEAYRMRNRRIGYRESLVLQK